MKQVVVSVSIYTSIKRPVDDIMSVVVRRHEPMNKGVKVNDNCLILTISGYLQIGLCDTLLLI